MFQYFSILFMSVDDVAPVTNKPVRGIMLKQDQE